MKQKRAKLMVDPKVQVPLLCRLLAYWVTGLVLMGVLVAMQVGIIASSAGFELKLSRILVSFGPVVVTSVILLPLFCLDCIRFSNRIAGPMHRLVGHVKRLADTGEAEEIKFRENDFWYELADQFNRVAARMKELEKDAPATATAEETNLEEIGTPS